MGRNNSTAQIWEGGVKLFQDKTSKEYRGNRSTENALYSVVPMLLEANFFSRHKTGIYQPLDKQSPQYAITNELYTKSYRANETINYKNEDLAFIEPYFFWSRYLF